MFFTKAAIISKGGFFLTSVPSGVIAELCRIDRKGLSTVSYKTAMGSYKAFSPCSFTDMAKRKC